MNKNDFKSVSEMFSAYRRALEDVEGRIGENFFAAVDMIAAKTAALRVNMNTDGCLLASQVASRFPSTSHAPSLLISSLSHNVRPPCTH